MDMDNLFSENRVSDRAEDLTKFFKNSPKQLAEGIEVDKSNTDINSLFSPHKLNESLAEKYIKKSEKVKSEEVDEERFIEIFQEYVLNQIDVEEEPQNIGFKLSNAILEALDVLFDVYTQDEVKDFYRAFVDGL